MIDKIIKELKGLKGVSAYKILNTKTSSKELFLIKDKADMLRGKDVEDILVTVYSDNEKNRGSSTVKLKKSMDNDEIAKILKDAVYAAKFVKNPYYPLAKKSDKEYENFNSSLKDMNETDALLRIKDIIYKDYGLDASINSSEIFINKKNKRIVNSEGVDVSFDQYEGIIEVITESGVGKEPVEIYTLNSFADIDEEYLEELIGRRLFEAAERGKASPTKKSDKINVILTGEDIRTFFTFYTGQASARAHYEKTALYKKGDNLFKGSKGDKLNLSLKAFMENSIYSAPFDNDGVYLEDVKLYKDGKLKNLHGSLRFTHYLDEETTGIIKNVEVQSGETTIEEMKKKPYLEILAFSDMFVDELTGDFGGEIRLARYFDGKDTFTVTGGSFSDNILEVQKKFLFSKETQLIPSFKGPKAILLKNVKVLGE
ncbi:MAG: modulator protein [Tissierellia bacterium]|nr:modulator protein [Tissierellia bacterium]